MSAEPAARTEHTVLVLLAAIFLAFHLPYLPRSLEDLDSINFALGVNQFDVAQHQPHPPGYPIYIVAAKLVHIVVPDVARTLGVLSVIAGSLGVIAIGALFRRLDRSLPTPWLVAATALAVACPLYWFTAARPLSDMTGLAAAIAVQAATLAASNRRALAGAAFAAGIAAGVRSQVAWLTVPLLIVKGLGDSRRGRGGWGTGGLREPAVERTVPKSPSPLVPALSAFVVGVLVWFAPLVAITGGPAAYWRVLSNQGAEDIGNISMLWTTHTVRAVMDALYSAFVGPWGSWAVAGVMIVVAIVGAIALALRNRSPLLLLAAAFGPYLIFDLLFQETFTGRYALPLVVPLAYLAVAALRRLPWNAGLAVAVALAMFGAHLAGTSIAAFSREKAPAFRLLDDMAAAAPAQAQPPVLAFDRRNMFDFRRPLVWVGDALPKFERRLSAPPQHEWLEAVNYWTAGGRAPVWFVVDPKRAAIDLVQHGEPRRYRWQLPYSDLVSGARPDEMDWYPVERPEWYVGEGWALTPEAAGVAETDRRGLTYGPITGWIALARPGGVIMIGGRNFEATRQVRMSISLDGKPLADEALAPGPFLRFLTVPALHGQEYSMLTIRGETGSRAAVEQFDVSARRPLVGFGAGWHEQELNPRTGLRWRWLSERGEIQLRLIAAGAALHVAGESPRKYFDRASRLVIRTGDRILDDRLVADDFSVDVPLPAGAQTLTLETDQTYVPAERSRRTGDRRRLGLRIFELGVGSRK